MKHLGDITKISGYEVPIVDCIIGGSPCQDLSVAGKRAGLDGERSGLFMEQIRIIKEMRERDRRETNHNGRDVRPRYMVWENVPGAFSSKSGEDFRAVLEETAKVADKKATIPRPTDGKWTTAGCIVGSGWSIAWRVLDAEFWGVPQRRRRIALVADFGGQSAPEICFVRKSLSGDTESCGEQRQGTATVAEDSTRTDDCGQPSISFQERAGCSGGGKGILIQYDHTGALSTQQHQFVVDVKPCSWDGGQVVSTITANNAAGQQRMPDKENFNCVIRPVCYENHSQDSRYREFGDCTPTLTSRLGTGGNNQPLVVALDRAAYNQGKNAKFDIGISEDGIAHTVIAKGPGAVAYAADLTNFAQSEVNGTLKASAAHNLESNNVVVLTDNVRYIVCRLTPMECERLQGYPDGWTDIGEWTDSKGKKRKTADAARYKALGNSIALPPWKWLLKRISAQYERDATMASLFDGIGGFPYLWEQINGKGSCLWASETDEFPIAVTERRINEKE